LSGVSMKDLDRFTLTIVVTGVEVRSTLAVGFAVITRKKHFG